MSISRKLKDALGPLRHRTDIVIFAKSGPEESTGTNIVELDKRDLLAFQARDQSTWTQQIDIPGAFDGGCRLFAVMHAGNLVSFGWSKHSRTFDVGEVPLTLELDIPVLWIFGCLTSPLHRNRGHYRSLIGSIRRMNDSPETYIFANERNHPSVRGIEQAGFSRCCYVRRRMVFVWLRRDPGARPMRFRSRLIGIGANSGIPAGAQSGAGGQT